MLNEVLRLVRVFHDLNKTQTADRVGLSKSYITEFERGDKKVTMQARASVRDMGSPRRIAARRPIGLVRDLYGGDAKFAVCSRIFLQFADAA